MYGAAQWEAWLEGIKSFDIARVVMAWTNEWEHSRRDESPKENWHTSEDIFFEQPAIPGSFQWLENYEFMKSHKSQSLDVTAAINANFFSGFTVPNDAFNGWK